MNPANAQPLLPRPELGLALAGGAARGFYHLGVLEALHEAGIRPDWYAGTSAGAIVGACAAGGLSIAEIRELARSISWQKSVVALRQSAWGMFGAMKSYVFRSPERLPAGFLENAKVARTIDAALGGRKLSQLKPLILTACDVTTGDEILFCSPAVAKHLVERTGCPAPRETESDWEQLYGHHTVISPMEDVGLAVRCSSCIPGVMMTVPTECADSEGGTRRRLLNDGGIVDLVPVKPLRAAGCRKVLAVFLGLVPRSDDPSHFAAVGFNSLNYLARDQLTSSLRQADYVIYDRRIEDVSLVRLDPKLIDMGYEFTRDRIPEIRKALGLELSAAA